MNDYPTIKEIVAEYTDSALLETYTEADYIKEFIREMAIRVLGEDKAEAATAEALCYIERLELK